MATRKVSISRCEAIPNKVDLVTKARVKVIAKEGKTDAIRKAAYTGKIGYEKIFIHPVDDALRVRTGERGESAV